MSRTIGLQRPCRICSLPTYSGDLCPDSQAGMRNRSRREPGSDNEPPRPVVITPPTPDVWARLTAPFGPRRGQDPSAGRRAALLRHRPGP